MYFDFDDRYEDVEAVGSAISRREGVVLSIVVHVGIVLALLLVPQLGLFQKSPEELEAEQQARLERQRQEREDQPTFVVVEPLRDVPKPPPPRAELSDQDRQASVPELAERPENPLPFARGNTAERVEAAPAERPRGEGPAPEPAPPAPERADEDVAPLPESTDGVPAPRRAEAAPTPPAPPAGGKLGEALRDLQKYVERETFNNPQGNQNDFGPLQFDTKGVEFGPWVRRFIAQVKRNWIVPNSALAMRGRVVIQFNVHKDGRITDLNVVRPSDIDSFNRSALNALMMSNPTTPLPPEYPDDKAFFTVTFYFNESPSPQ